METSAERLYKELMTSLVFLRRVQLKYGEPISVEYLKKRISKIVLFRLVQESYCNVYEDYYWDTDLNKRVPGMEISFKGLWKVYLEVPPKNK